MTPDERNLLGRFLQDLGQARGGLKDAEAAGMIDRAVSANPDAAYLLVQHAIIADQALHAAQARVSELEAQVAGQSQGQGQGGFLGGGGGPWAGGQAQPQAGYSQTQQGGYGQGGYAQGPYGQGGYAPQQGAAPPRQGGVLGGLFGGGQGQGAPAQPGGFGSFLRSAGTMAAGVAGGEFLFSGLSNMFGGGERGGFGGGFGGAPVENVTINEYGDNGGFGGGGGFDDGGVDGGGYDDGGMN